MGWPVAVSLLVARSQDTEALPLVVHNLGIEALLVVPAAAASSHP